MSACSIGAEETAGSFGNMSKVVPDTRTLDIAPTGRGSCKKCGVVMEEGSVRVSYLVSLSCCPSLPCHTADPPPHG